ALVVDRVAGSDPTQRSILGVIVLAVSLLLGIALLDQLQKLAIAVLGTYVGEHLVLNFRAELFRHVQRLSMSYHDAKGTADASYRIYWDAASIQWMSVSGVPPLVSGALMLAGMVCVTAWIDWRLALVGLGGWHWWRWASCPSCS